MASPALSELLLLLQQVEGRCVSIEAKIDLLTQSVSQVVAQNNQILSQISGLSGFSGTALDNLQIILSEVASTDERNLSEKLDICEQKADSILEAVNQIEGATP